MNTRHKKPTKPQASSGWRAANKRNCVAAKNPAAARTLILAEEPSRLRFFLSGPVPRWLMAAVRMLRQQGSRRPAPQYDGRPAFQHHEITGV
jgi:hypothetical protein